MSIINGLFAARGGLSSHGTAIAVIGDNLSNANTTAFKSGRAEFEDVLAGGQTAGKIIGSGSSISAVSSSFVQGTIEFTNRTLDIAIDGNGFFVVTDGANRFYSRAGNFKLNSEGEIVNQNGLKLLGFPASGTGSLAPISIGAIDQSNIGTTRIELAGNVDAGAQIIGVGDIPTTVDAGDAPPSLPDPPITTTYADLSSVAEFSTVVDIFDSLGGSHTVTFYFFHTGENQYTVRGYVNSEDVDPSGSETGLPRLLVDADGNGNIVMEFDGNGLRNNAPSAGSFDLLAVIPWNNGSDSSTIGIRLPNFTQYLSGSSISNIFQNGQGVGTVTSLSIQTNGDVFAVLSNGQSAIVATLGLANFRNPEGLTRVGNQLFQTSPESGSAIVGKPKTGTLGGVQAGAIELSTVDIASEFVKLITIQRGFQANSRIITSINQLLQEIISLA